MKNSFVLYYDLDEVFKLLLDEEAGQLIKAVFAFEVHGEVTEFDDRMMQSTYRRITDSLVRNKVKYENTCRKKSESARKRFEEMS